MKKTIIFFTLLPVLMSAQVGIGTTDPKATLDVRESDPANPTAYAGIAIPQVQILPNSGNRSGQLVLLTSDNKFYYFNGAIWSPIGETNLSGDIKQGLQTVDYEGWIKLDGRAISTLTANQQAQAILLGFSTNLPDATNSFLVQNGTSMGSISGSNTIIIDQNQLPNITLTGTTSTDGNHTHTYGLPKGDANRSNGAGNTLWGNTFNLNRNTGASGNHNHTFTTSSINGNVLQQPINITPQSLSVNTFLYLGN